MISSRADDPVLLRRLSAVEKIKLGVKSSVGPSGAAGPAGPSFQFPVGSIFMAVVSTNPAALLGYGTWTALAAGRVLIGDNGTTFPAGATGGAATVAAAGTNANESAHTHSVTSNVAVADHGAFATGVNDVTSLQTIVAGATDIAGGGHVHTVTPPAHSVTNNAVTSAAGSAHTHAFTGSATSVVQPYLVVFIWSRAS